MTINSDILELGTTFVELLPAALSRCNIRKKILLILILGKITLLVVSHIIKIYW